MTCLNWLQHCGCLEKLPDKYVRFQGADPWILWLWWGIPVQKSSRFQVESLASFVPFTSGWVAFVCSWSILGLDKMAAQSAKWSSHPGPAVSLISWPVSSLYYNVRGSQNKPFALIIVLFWALWGFRTSGFHCNLVLVQRWFSNLFCWTQTSPF